MTCLGQNNSVCRCPQSLLTEVRDECLPAVDVHLAERAAGIDAQPRVNAGLVEVVGAGQLTELCSVAITAQTDAAHLQDKDRMGKRRRGEAEEEGGRREEGTKETVSASWSH